MTAEYLLRTLLIIGILFMSGYFACRIRVLINWIKHEDIFYTPEPGMRLIPCQVLNEIRKFAKFILLTVGLVCVLEYGWIVYRYTTPPTPTEYFAYKLAVETAK